MDLTKAFGEVNRTILRTALYKKGIPVEMITHIRRGHQNTRLTPKTKGRYGKQTPNNVGVFQWSAVIALLFVIYRDDVMEAYDALNHKNETLLKHTQERAKEEIGKNVASEIRTQFGALRKEQNLQFVQNYITTKPQCKYKKIRHMEN